MDNDCKAQTEIVASITKIAGKLDELIKEQRRQNEKLEAIASTLGSIENYAAGQSE